MLVNLKKFKSTEEFFSRAKLVIQPTNTNLNFSLLIDDKVAGMVSYFVLEEDENCRPNPYQDKIMGGVQGDPNPFGYQNQINDFVIDNEPYQEIPVIILSMHPLAI